MSKMRVFPLIALCTLGLLGAANGGCHAEAKIGNPEPKVAPPPPPPAPPPPPVVEAPKPEIKPVAIKAIGKAKIVNNEIQIPGKIQFDFDKSTIKETPETQDILNTLVSVMKENPSITKLQVAGHTDDKGTLDRNQKLSQERADAVAAWLATKGVDKSRLATVGFGPSKPLNPNDNEAHREANRRTEFKIWEIDSKPTDAAKAADSVATPPPPPAGTAGKAGTTATTPPAPPKTPAPPATPGPPAKPAPKK